MRYSDDVTHNVRSIEYYPNLNSFEIATKVLQIMIIIIINSVIIIIK